MNFTPKVLVRSEESGGHVALCENVAPPHWAGPPLHHHDFDETFHVLEGELTFLIGDEVVTAGPGSATVAPRGIHHTVANASDAPARYLLVCTPGGFERMFSRLEAMRPYPETTMVGPTVFAHLGGAGLHPSGRFLRGR